MNQIPEPDEMDYFNNLLEILAPSPAPKEPIKNQVLEVGVEVALKSIDGQLFHCTTLVPVSQFTSQSVRSKYILAITYTQIVELQPHSSKYGVAVVVDAHELQALVKLKFKKGEDGILLLEYKNSKISRLYMEDPAVCVGHIKTRMREVGIDGSVKNKNEKIIENAQGFFFEAKKIETQFSLSPSVEYVQEMMDLLRKAAEKFAEANDNSYTDVMGFIKKFLQRSDVNAVLDAKMSYPSIPHTDPDAPMVSLHALLDDTNANAVPEEQPIVTTSTTHKRVDIYPEDAPRTPPHGSSLAALPSSDSLYTPLMDFSLPLPDVDAELHTLQNALTYQFDEEDHLYTPHYSALSSSHAKAVLSPPCAEQCELTDMLDSMTNELDTLLHSFNEPSDNSLQDANTTIATADINDNNATLGSENKYIDFDVSDTGFLEVDFAQTLLDEMVKM